MLNLRINPLKPHPHHRNHQKTNQAPLRPHRPSSNPSRPMKRRTKQMSRRNHTTIGHRIKKTLAPVPSRMESHRKPQTPSAPQSETKEKPDQPCSQRTSPSFSLVVQMD